MSPGILLTCPVLSLLLLHCLHSFPGEVSICGVPPTGNMGGAKCHMRYYLPVQFSACCCCTASTASLEKYPSVESRPLVIWAGPGVTWDTTYLSSSQLEYLSVESRPLAIWAEPSVTWDTTYLSSSQLVVAALPPQLPWRSIHLWSPAHWQCGRGQVSHGILPTCPVLSLLLLHCLHSFPGEVSICGVPPTGNMGGAKCHMGYGGGL